MRAGQGAGISGAGMVFQQAMSFVSGVVIARMLGAADYGTFNIVRNIAFIVIIFTKAGLDIGLNRRLGERLTIEAPAKAGQISLCAAAVVMFLSVLWIVICALGLANYLEHHYYPQIGFASFMLQMMIIVPLWSLLQIITATFRARLDPAPAIIGELVIQPTIRLGLAVLLLIFGYGIGGVIWAHVLAALIALAYVGNCAKKTFSLDLMQLKGLPWKELWVVQHYSLTLAICVGIVTITKLVDILVLGKYVEAAEVGRYAVVQMSAVLLTLFGSAFGQLLGPQIASLWSSGQRTAVGALLKDNTRLIVITAAPFFTILLFFGQDLMLIFGADFHVSFWIVICLATSQFIASVFGNCGWVLSMTGRHNIEMWALALGLFSALGLNFLLVPTYGSLGASVATVISVAVANIARVWAVYVYAGFFPFRTDIFYVLGISLIISSTLKICTLLMGWKDDFVTAIVVSTTCLFIYSWVIIKFVLHKEERSWLQLRIKYLLRLERSMR